MADITRKPAVILLMYRQAPIFPRPESLPVPDARRSVQINNNRFYSVPIIFSPVANMPYMFYNQSDNVHYKQFSPADVLLIQATRDNVLLHIPRHGKNRGFQAALIIARQTSLLCSLRSVCIKKLFSACGFRFDSAFTECGEEQFFCHAFTSSS